MCGRFTLTSTDYTKLAEELRATIRPEYAELFRPRYNIAPGDMHWILAMNLGMRELQPAKWGLVPSWAKDDSGFINARSESVDSKPAFRSAFRSRRCLVPADGFFEWKGTKPPKQPFWFHREARELILFAGLYEDHVSKKTGEEIRTFTILTTDAAPWIRHVHDRMPVILPTAVADQWIAGSATDVKEILRSASEFNLMGDAVTTYVNSARNDDPKCLTLSLPSTY